MNHPKRTRFKYVDHSQPGQGWTGRI